MERQAIGWTSREIFVYAVLGHGYGLAGISWDGRLEYNCIALTIPVSQHMADLEVATSILYFQEFI